MSSSFAISSVVCSSYWLWLHRDLFCIVRCLVQVRHMYGASSVSSVQVFICYVCTVLRNIAVCEIVKWVAREGFELTVLEILNLYSNVSQIFITWQFFLLGCLCAVAMFTMWQTTPTHFQPFFKFVHGHRVSPLSIQSIRCAVVTLRVTSRQANVYITVYSCCTRTPKSPPAGWPYWGLSWFTSVVPGKW